MVQCPLCPVLLQRTDGGDIFDGFERHYATVHPKESRAVLIAAREEFAARVSRARLRPTP